MNKNEFYNQVNAEIAEKYGTSPAIIKFVRNYGISQFKLIPLQDLVEEKIEKLDKTIDENLLAMRKITLVRHTATFDTEAQRIFKISEYINLCLKKRNLLRDIYVFLRKLSDEKFEDITKNRPYKI